MDHLREQIYLAALLHDIGKFYQRADNRLSEENKLNKNTHKLADYITRLTDYGKIKWQHVLWTNQFFEDNSEIINQIKEEGTEVFKINPFNPDLHYENNLQNLAVFHHRPATKEQAIIQLADWWSSGMDRRKMKDLVDEKNYIKDSINWGVYPYKKIPLQSLFPFLQTKNKEGEIYSSSDIHYYHQLSKLDCFDKKTVFPYYIKQEDVKNLQHEYASLWKDFSKDVEKLPTDSIDGFTETMFYLLKKYTWCIPSSTRDLPNVSLFEHLKTTAAIADSLYTFHNMNPGAFEWIEDKLGRHIDRVQQEAYPLLLFCCDISGIQKFIYDIHNSKAAVSLKGRSFYIQLLVETIIQRIIKHEYINAKSGHVIYSSGGQFYMLLPNTKDVTNALAEIEEEFENNLWDEHNGRLYAAFGWLPFYYDVKNKKIYSNEKLPDSGDIDLLGDLWFAVSHKASEKKKRKFKSIIIKKDYEFFKPKGGGDTSAVDGKLKLCAVTGEEITDQGKVLNYEDNPSDNEKIWVLKSVYEQTELGKVLKDFNYILTFNKLSKDGNDYINNRRKAGIEPASAKIHHYLFDESELTFEKAEFRKITSADYCRVQRLNNTDFLWDSKLKGQKASYGYTFYGGNDQAYFRNNDGSIQYDNRGKKVKKFEDLVKITEAIDSEEEADNTYLGILRMDVDGLGQIFKSGFDSKNKSFAAFSTLSFQLDLFFSGFLNDIRNRDDYRDYVNILYSGGDDLFAVGRFDKLIDFAITIRYEFRKFVCNREDISISGGLVTVHPKFPIAKAATMAGEAEERAKEFNNEEKNAFCFLGETISWNKECDIVKDWKNKLVEFCSDEYNPLSRSFLNKLRQYKAVKDKHLYDSQKDKQKSDLSYKWNTAYFFGRYINDHFKKKYYMNETQKENLKNKHRFLDELKNDLFCDDRNYDLAALAARWAELILRFNLNKVIEA